MFKGRIKDFPREVNIGYAIWKVRFVSVIPERANKNEILVGLACPMDQVLYILKYLSPFDRLVVFLHELQHGLEDEHGFEIDHDVLNKLDKAQAQFLCDNFLGELSKKNRNKKLIGGVDI